jgi:hypothetical protein
VLPEQWLTLKSVSFWLSTEHSPSLDAPKRWPVAPWQIRILRVEDAGMRANVNMTKPQFRKAYARQ